MTVEKEKQVGWKQKIVHEITICNYTIEGDIPAKRRGRVWRLDKEVID